jgi:hypothetical protein
MKITILRTKEVHSHLPENPMPSRYYHYVLNARPWRALSPSNDPQKHQSWLGSTRMTSDSHSISMQTSRRPSQLMEGLWKIESTGE